MTPFPHPLRAVLAGAATAVVICLHSPEARAADPDPWLGPDKALHFGVSVGLAGGGYALSALVLERPWQRAVAGAGFSLTLGAGKELYDLSGHGDPSWKDFTWDVAGTAVGIGIALLVDAAISSSSSSRAPASAPSAIRGSQFAIAF
jgi:putative lipoprotein